MFALYYGFGVWVTCEADGSLDCSHPSQFDAELYADLVNWMRSL